MTPKIKFLIFFGLMLMGLLYILSEEIKEDLLNRKQICKENDRTDVQ